MGFDPFRAVRSDLFRRPQHELLESAASPLYRWKVLQVSPDLVPNAPECREALLFRTLDSRRILEVLVQPIRLAGVDGTALLPVVADREHVIEIPTREFIHML